MSDSNSSNPASGKPRPFRSPTLVYTVATISATLLLVTLVFLFLNRAKLENPEVQSWARFFFAFWTVAPPIWFWFEYHYLWSTVHDPARTDLLERYKLSLETSSKIWLAVVTLLGAFCWAGLDAKDKAPAVTCDQIAAMKRVMAELETANDEVWKEPSNTGVSLSQMAAKMKKMDYQTCPGDFGEAFIRLAWAFDKAALEAKKHPDKLSVALNLGLRLLAGQKDAGVVEMTDELHAVTQELYRWNAELDALCARYGVKPKSP